MADEILVLEGGIVDRRRQYQVLYLIPIPAPTPHPNGGNVVPTPAVDPALTPDGATPGYAFLTAGEIAALNAGTMAWVVDTVTRDPQLSAAQTTALLQDRYAAAKAKFDAEYAVRYAFIGLRRNAP